MRRLLSIATIAAFGLAPLIAHSQMRGGMGGAGHVSAPVSGPRGAAPAMAPRAAPVMAPRAAPVMAPRAAPTMVPRAAPVMAPSVAPGAVGVRTIGVRTVTPSGVVVTRTFAPFPHHFRQRVFFGGCFNGFNCFNPFFFPGFGFGFGTGFGLGATYVPYYAPYYPPDYYSSPAQYYPPDYYSMTPPQTSTQENANDVYLAQMLQKLTDEVEAMKNDQKSRSTSAVVLGPKADTAGPAVVFVFHDGTRITTHNYAIAGQTIWVFSENQARKFRLTDLDRAATEQANAANGIELRLPEPPPAR